MRFTPSTITNTGAPTVTGANGVVAGINQNPPEVQAVFGASGAFTGATMNADGMLEGGSVWYPLMFRDRKTGTRYSGSAALSDNTTTSFLADTRGLSQVRWYASAAGSLGGLVAEVITGSINDFGGGNPQIDLPFTGTSTFTSGITFNGATGTNLITVPTGEANAVAITDGTNTYLTVNSTSGTTTIGKATGTVNLASQNLAFGTQATPAAAGTTQGTATALTATNNLVTTGSANAGVVLPSAAVLNQEVSVMNTSATNTLKVYPDGTGTVNGGAASTAKTLAANTGATYLCTSAGPNAQWYSLSN